MTELEVGTLNTVQSIIMGHHHHHRMTNMASYLILVMILGLYLQMKLTSGEIACNCGPAWTAEGCTIDFAPESCRDAGEGVSTDDGFSSSPRTLRAEPYVSRQSLGVKVSFKAPEDNPAAVKKFTVTLVAKDYPVGWGDCLTVTLHQPIHENNTFSLRCWSNVNLLPRHKFGITVQPYPVHSVQDGISNSKQLDYTLPGCHRLASGEYEHVQACDNYETPIRWQSRYIEAFPVANRPQFTVVFDTYEYLETDPNRIYTYKLVVSCAGGSGTCPKPYVKYVDCTETLQLGKPACNYTFNNIYPGQYVVKQQISQVTDDGGIISGAIAKVSDPFSIRDTEDPEIINMPQDIIVHIDANETSANVTWVSPNVTDNFAFAGLQLTSDHESGTYFPVGETVVSYTATDSFGNFDVASFKVFVAVPTTMSPVVTYKTAQSSSANSGGKKDSWHLVLAIAGGSLCGIILLACIMRWKGPLKKKECGKDERRPPKPTENTDITPYSAQNDNDRGGLVKLEKDEDASHTNVLCASEYCNSFDAVLDDVSLTGKVFGGTNQPNAYPSTPAPAYQPSSPYHQSFPQSYKTPTVTVNITQGPPAHHQGGQPRAWVSTCVENCDPKREFKSLESCDSGCDAGMVEYLEYPTADITSASQIEGAIEC